MRFQQHKYICIYFTMLIFNFFIIIYLMLYDLWRGMKSDTGVSNQKIFEIIFDSKYK